jgi:hypothetical protein
MSIKPPLSCPPDYSILVFRLTECKKAGVVKGVETLAATDLNGLYIPIKEHTEGTLTLKGNTEKVLNIDDIAEYWPMLETYSFSIDLTTYPTIFDDGISFSYSLYDDELTFFETITFTIDSSDPSYEDFPTAFTTALDDSTVIKTLVSVDTSNVLTSGSFSASALVKGSKYRHVFTFDTGDDVFEYETPGTLITPATKYPKGSVKYILIYPQYDKVDTKTCGCADTSGDMRSNQKYFQWVNRGEYDAVNDTENTPIEVDTHTSNQDNFTWNYSTAVPHIGYVFSDNDMVEFSSNTFNTPIRNFIVSIDGPTVNIDGSPNTSLTGNTTQHVYAPSSPRWSNVGDFLFLSGATDIEDVDKCFIETIVLKNPHSFDIPMRYMIGR